jgi:hypothetical protein
MSKKNQDIFSTFSSPCHSGLLPFLLYPNGQVEDFAEGISRSARKKSDGMLKTCLPC